MAVSGFTGRAEHLAALDGLLPHEDHVAGGAVVISAVDGTAGVGKTTLAVHWAHRVQHHFPDGTLFVNLRGYGPATPATPDEALAGFLHALGVPGDRIPPGLDAQAGLYRSVLAGRRVLIVLDNANSVHQVRPLLPGSPGSLVVVTSRARLTGLVIGEAATRLTLDLLTSAEARRLLHATLGPVRIAAEPEAVAALIRYCARLPLALRIAAGHAAAHPHTTLGELVAEMAGDQTRLDLLSNIGDHTLAVRAVFAWSYRQLTEQQARLFRRLGLHPGPEISLHVAAAIAEVGLAPARHLLGALTEVHLVQQVARDRYRFHDLLRAYAAELTEAEDLPEDRARLHRALLQWYAHHIKTAYVIDRPAFSSRLRILEAPTTTHPVITFDGVAHAWQWAELESDNLVAAARTAAHQGHDDLVLLLGITTVNFLSRKALSAEELELDWLCLTAGRRSGDQAAEYEALMNLGEMLQRLSRLDEAFAVFHDARVLARTLGDPGREAAALLDLGRWCSQQGRCAEALDYFQKALPLSPGAQNGRLEGVIECYLSMAHAGLGSHHQALHHARRGLSLRQQAVDRIGEAEALEQLARAHQGLGAHQEAIAVCEQALTISESYPLESAGILDALGTSLCHIGNTQRAITCWREALAIFEAFGDYQAADLRTRLRALETREPENS
ncbi:MULTISPECIES: tetratricopeptide repeat protein [unclassified Crossiella]|uniref:ATP-binding protein n=1 Tax=unclassified Crossiella TaxID=2620835 RepID=UPI001FFF99CA|nr:MULTISPECIES: tetratricopeptide repeat protein [unclassified Crossiella]MCK2245212.1 tetratricopeptide repeat protein [Crossiella sp. S99.2]MCK2258866.1 tetratricopeptide repeat protein [Crossiella sp. S99.1]